MLLNALFSLFDQVVQYLLDIRKLLAEDNMATPCSVNA